MEEEVGRRAEVMDVAEVDLEVVVRGTLEGVVEEEVVEVGGQPEDCEGEGGRVEVMALTEVLGVEVEVGAEPAVEDWRLEVVKVAVEQEEETVEAEVVEKGRVVEVVEVEEDLEVVKGAEEDLEVVERGAEEEMVEDDEEVDEVGRGARVMDFAEKRLEAVEWGMQEEVVVKLVVGVGRRAEVMEVAEED
eukprot:SM000009S23532  [mRNA]  locus=s9:571604:572257:- [translate_table: standard]